MMSTSITFNKRKMMKKISPCCLSPIEALCTKKNKNKNTRELVGCCHCLIAFWLLPWPSLNKVQTSQFPFQIGFESLCNWSFERLKLVGCRIIITRPKTCCKSHVQSLNPTSTPSIRIASPPSPLAGTARSPSTSCHCCCQHCSSSHQHLHYLCC